MAAHKLSRLELCVEILNAVEKQPHLTFRDLREKIQTDNKSLLTTIDFLEKQGLINSVSDENETVYDNTPRGLIVAKFFASRTQVVPQGNFVCGTPNPESDYPL